jgi:hypothetical protein
MLTACGCDCDRDCGLLQKRRSSERNPSWNMIAHDNCECECDNFLKRADLFLVHSAEAYFAVATAQSRQGGPSWLLDYAMRSVLTWRMFVWRIVV